MVLLELVLPAFLFYTTHLIFNPDFAWHELSVSTHLSLFFPFSAFFSSSHLDFLLSTGLLALIEYLVCDTWFSGFRLPNGNLLFFFQNCFSHLSSYFFFFLLPLLHLLIIPMALPHVDYSWRLLQLPFPPQILVLLYPHLTLFPFFHFSPQLPLYTLFPYLYPSIPLYTLYTPSLPLYWLPIDNWGPWLPLDYWLTTEAHLYSELSVELMGLAGGPLAPFFSLTTLSSLYCLTSLLYSFLPS